MDAPSIVRGVATGFLARPTSKASIGKVFQDRAAQYADRPFIKFGDRSLTYAQANATVNRYAAVLAERGVTRGDVVGIMLRNSPNAVLMMLPRSNAAPSRACSTTTSAATCCPTASVCSTRSCWWPRAISSSTSPTAAPTVRRR